MMKELVLAALTALFGSYEAETTEKLLAKDYIQHNPALPSGRDVIVSLLPELKKSGITATTFRLIAEGNIVVAHNRYDNAQALGGETMVVFDVFRIENGKLAEHWDNLAALTPPNPAGRSQLDGPTEIVDLDKTAANKELVTDFVHSILVAGKMERLPSFFNGDRYLQHNSQIGDGLSGLGAALEAMAKKGIIMKYEKVHMVVAEGNFVFTMSEGTLGGEATAFFDLFRVEGGKIAEHWDVISSIPAKMAHTNGKF
ncbi:MAG: polyketide cyclase [Rhodomicrobium sp.]|nr:MAG: polyketide cyclase [Rhodomicrobium sp.]